MVVFGGGGAGRTTAYKCSILFNKYRSFMVGIGESVPKHEVEMGEWVGFRVCE